MAIHHKPYHTYRRADPIKNLLAVYGSSVLAELNSHLTALRTPHQLRLGQIGETVCEAGFIVRRLAISKQILPRGGQQEMRDAFKRSWSPFSSFEEVLGIAGAVAQGRGVRGIEAALRMQGVELGLESEEECH
jgi:hypothetical protein